MHEAGDRILAQLAMENAGLLAGHIAVFVKLPDLVISCAINIILTLMNIYTYVYIYTYMVVNTYNWSLIFIYTCIFTHLQNVIP